jgi:predicted PurR-regulated permease PerM
MQEKINQYLYYIIIGVLSFISVTILPMLGSEVGLQWNIPTTTAGWVVYCVSTGLVAMLNILIFHSFIQQGKLNIKDNPNYMAARKILVHSNKEFKPRSPGQWAKRTYGGKGTSIAVGSIISVIGIGNAVLTYNVTSLLSYAITIVFGVVFGIFQMKATELYFTTEYYEYAKEVENNAH